MVYNKYGDTYFRGMSLHGLLLLYQHQAPKKRGLYPMLPMWGPVADAASDFEKRLPVGVACTADSWERGSNSYYNGLPDKKGLK